jgi:very-short-patch-repair endonuclease
MARPSRTVLAARAAAMRAAPTWSELLLRERLSREQLGVPFRTQFVVGGRYIVDFAAPAARLVVEVDGGVHRDRVRADARRDRDLRRLGWRVLRLPDHLVTQQLDVAVALVRAALWQGA